MATSSSSSQPLLLFILLLLFSLLSLLSTTTAHPNPKPKPKPNNSTTSFIWKSCQTTRYPSLCYHSLSPFSTKIKHSERQLALTALAVSLSRARSTAQFVSKLKKEKTVKISHRELEAVMDCVDTMGDSVDQLSRSIKELGHMMGAHTNGEDFLWHMSNVQTWVSAALTNENTCVDGLSGQLLKGGKVKGAIRMRVNNVAQVTSNALALVNHFAAKYGASTNDHPKNP